MNFRWQVKTGQYQSGENLYINTIRVGSYEWNSSLKTNIPEYIGLHRYTGIVLLPGFVNHYFFGATPEEIKAQIEKQVVLWFAEINREV